MSQQVLNVRSPFWKNNKVLSFEELEYLILHKTKNVVQFLHVLEANGRVNGK